MKRFFQSIILIAAAAISVLLPIAGNALPILAQGQGKPAWVYNDAQYDYDFSNNRYWNGGGVFWGDNSSATKRSPAGNTYSNSGATAGTLFTQTTSGVLVPTKTIYYPRISIGYGEWSEGDGNNSHNYALQSRDFTQAVWTLSNISATKTGIVGADGTTGNASRLTATGAGGTALQTLVFTGKLDTLQTQAVAAGGTGYATNNILTLSGGSCATAPQVKVSAQSGGVVTAFSTQTAGSCTALPASPVSLTGGAGSGATLTAFWRQATFSVWIKCVTCTGAISLTSDNGSTWTDISGSLSTSAFTQVKINTFNLVNNVVGIKITNINDVIVADMAQAEDGDTATSPVVSAATVNFRGPELAALFGSISDPNSNYGLNTLHNVQAGSPVAMLYQYSGNFSKTQSHLIWGDDVTNIFVTGAAGGGVIHVVGHTVGGANTSNSTYDSTDSDVSGLFTLNKVYVAWNGDRSMVCVNGGAPTINNSTGFRPSELAGLTHGGTLNVGSNIEPTNGYVKRITMWHKEGNIGDCMRLTEAAAP